MNVQTVVAIVVSGVVVIELLHMSFSTHVIYNAFAASFGSPTAFTDSPFSAAALPALNGSGEGSLQGSEYRKS